MLGHVLAQWLGWQQMIYFNDFFAVRSRYLLAWAVISLERPLVAGHA